MYLSPTKILQTSIIKWVEQHVFLYFKHDKIKYTLIDFSWGWSKGLAVLTNLWVTMRCIDSRLSDLKKLIRDKQTFIKVRTIFGVAEFNVLPILFKMERRAAGEGLVFTTI